MLLFKMGVCAVSKIKAEFFSESLKRPVSVNIVIPEGDVRGMNTLFLLHGYTDNSSYWNIGDLARSCGFAAVMPDGGNSFYLDSEATGERYCSYIGSELLEFVRRTFGLALSAENTGICGLSMGGFGALHTAFAYPESFGMVGAMSSALIVHDIAHMKPGEDNGVANYAYYRHCFGDLEAVEDSTANPEVQIRLLQKEGRRIPKIYMCCGTEDFLLEQNRCMHRFLDGEGVPHIYTESSGTHDRAFWDMELPKIVRWMFGGEKRHE